MNAAYFARVEAAFLEGAGRGLMLSARDVALVERWARAGVPVDVVEAGVHQAFRGQNPQRVRSLSYTAPAVEEAIRAWRARNVGAAPSHAPTPVDDDTALTALADRYASLDVGAAFRPACDRAAADVRDLAAAHDHSPDALRALEARLCEALLEAMPLADRRAIEAAVDVRLADQRADPAIRRAQLWRATREHLRLPPLVIHREAW